MYDIEFLIQVFNEASLRHEQVQQHGRIQPYNVRDGLKAVADLFKPCHAVFVGDAGSEDDLLNAIGAGLLVGNRYVVMDAGYINDVHCLHVINYGVFNSVMFKDKKA